MGVEATGSLTAEVCFCGLRFVVPSEQLRPRPSSAPLVQAAQDRWMARLWHGDLSKQVTLPDKSNTTNRLERGK